MRAERWLILVVFGYAAAAGLPRAFADSQQQTVTCKDGSTSKAGQGACSHHGGVATTPPMVKCKDGAMSHAGRGACSGHGGVATGPAELNAR
jgi:hypothetical protein